jgi:hypothetical protein
MQNAPLKTITVTLLLFASKAHSNCIQDGKILARIGFVISEHNLGNLQNGAASYEDAVKKDVDIFSKTTDAVFVATADYVPPGTVQDSVTKLNGTPVTHMQLKMNYEGEFIDRLPKFEKQVRELIDANPKFREVYKHPGDSASKDEIEKYYDRARTGVQLIVAGSNHGSVAFGYEGAVNSDGKTRAKLTNLSGEITPSMIGSLGKKSYQAMATSFRGMPTVHMFGQCHGNDAARELIDNQITENRKIDSNLECACFASQAQAHMLASNPRVGEQFESEPFKRLDNETQKYTLLQAAGRGIKHFDLATSIMTNENGTIKEVPYAKDSGMTGSETTFLPDILREFQIDHPAFYNFKDPSDLSVVLTKKSDGSDLFSESEKQSILYSDLERMKAVYSNLGKNVSLDTDIKNIDQLYTYVTEKRKEIILFLKQYKQTRSEQTSSNAKLEASKRSVVTKSNSLLDISKKKYYQTANPEVKKSISVILGNVGQLRDFANNIDIKKTKMSMGLSENWAQYLEAKKMVSSLTDSIANVSDTFIHNAHKDLDQKAFKELSKEIQSVIDAADSYLADLVEPVKPVLIAETILSRTLVEAKVMKYMSEKDDPTLAKKKEEFFNQRNCELMDIRPNGTQMYGARKTVDPKASKTQHGQQQQQ